MTQLTALMAIIALLISVAALLLSLANTTRVARLDRQFPRIDSGLLEGSGIPTEDLREFFTAEELESFSRGPTVAIFTSPECPPCRELYAKLSDLDKPDQSVYVFEGADPSEEASSLPDWICKTSDANRRVQRAFKVVATPQTFVIGGAKIQRTIVGPSTEWHSSKSARTGFRTALPQ